ncbi:MAG: hypothetical protein J6T74_03395 [Clostridia bacterium]|nr:hypothetical protein [Clostridia bacterium]
MANYTSFEALVSKMKVQITTKNDQTVKALLRIYANQTHDEKQNEDTIHRNNVGFIPQDAKMLSSMANFKIKNGFLTEKQIKLIQPMIAKYAGQLVRCAIEEGKIRKVGNNYIY